MPETPPEDAKAKASDGVPRTPVPPAPSGSDEAPPTPLRKRVRVGLRIPDDEVARQPVAPPGAAEARAATPPAEDVAIRPTRIITRSTPIPAPSHSRRPKSTCPQRPGIPATSRTASLQNCAPRNVASSGRNPHLGADSRFASRTSSARRRPRRALT